MAEDGNNRAKKESTLVPSSSNLPRQTQDIEIEDPDDPVKSVPNSANNSSTREACYAVLQSWVSKKFMTGCVVLFPVAVTFFVT
ncbi:protein LIKE COV 2-like [Olea europaea var. sylvestris]|nr:protein LIKE COV 2-like [Olea europaea var. sylvestris]